MQKELFKYQSILTKDELQQLQNQYDQIDWQLVEKQQKLIESKEVSTPFSIEPVKEFARQVTNMQRKKGKQAIANGEVACLTVAGGQGTRLGFDGPKGLFLLNSEGLTLFEIFAKKILKKSEEYQRELPWAIMTSPLNHLETIEFFEKKNYFGLKKRQILFFQQKMLPFLDEQGKLFLETSFQIAEGPAGNGSAVNCLVECGVATKWEQEGVKHFSFTQIDNALADPFNEENIGYHIDQEAEITSICVERKSIEESVGIVVKEGKSILIKEYTELPSAEMHALDERKQPKHLLANISLFCFSLSFIQKISTSVNQLPLHKNFKKASYLDDDRNTVKPKVANAWKFEYFIIDVLSFSDSVSIICLERNKCFAPLKNAQGADSPKTLLSLINK